MMTKTEMDKHTRIVQAVDPYEYCGKVSQVIGLTVEAVGINAKMGEICRIYAGSRGEYVLAEVVGFRGKTVLLMPLGELTGIGSDNYVVPTKDAFKVPVGTEFLGRVLDGLGAPMDEKGPVSIDDHYPIDNRPPNPLTRGVRDHAKAVGAFGHGASGVDHGAVHGARRRGRHERAHRRYGAGHS